MAMVDDGIIIMVIGMLGVFSFLIVMVLSMSSMSSYILKAFPETNQTLPKTSGRGDAEIAVAIAAAYTQNWRG